MAVGPWRFVGLDVGGTTMKAGVVDDAGKPLALVSLPTEPHRGQDHGLATMVECIRQAVRAAKLDIKDVSAVGVATPGLMDIPAGLIVDPPNLKPWRNVSVRQHVAEAFGLPTAFQNDANAAAMGEFWAGAGSGFQSMVLFTLGTGIGGGVIIDGEVLEGRHSHGGELGHTKVEARSSRVCGCGGRGCLEVYASATAVVQRTHEALNAGGDGAALRAVLHERGEITSKDVFDAAAAGDALADRIVDETAFYLAVGAANAMATIDPDLIAFAGGMVHAGPTFLARIQEHLKVVGLPIPVARTAIRFAKLGSDAGFIGAAACGRQLFLKQRVAVA